MIYLKSFTLPTQGEEEDWEERYWSRRAGGNPHPNAYPYGIFPYKGLRRIDFSEITIFSGGNGSGKSTLLNLIAEALNLPRVTPFNTSEFFHEYIRLMCKWETLGKRGVAPGSAIYTSDDVFYGLIDRRVENFETEDRRREAGEEYRNIDDFVYMMCRSKNIILTILIILLVCELAIVGIKFLMPDSAAAGFIDDYTVKIIQWASTKFNLF